MFVSFVAKFEFLRGMSACFNSNLEVVGYFKVIMGESACSWCLSLRRWDFGKLSSCSHHTFKPLKVLAQVLSWFFFSGFWLLLF